MKVRTIVAASALLALAAGGAWWGLSRQAAPLGWRTVPLARQDVRATVSATGTLAAVTTVEVGTQVSGTVQALLADFNDQVTAGQVIARIDTSLLSADVASARATLSVRQAEQSQADQDLARIQGLHAQGAVSQQELEDAGTQAVVAKAQAQAARVALDRASRNLGYATITSPVDGTVIERDVDVGQTVNAGMTAPKLFLIAGDLARMQILASVDESDIGRIHEAQEVDFTVQAFPRDTFHGTVRQVRLQSAINENVVTYTVVVDVDNSDGRLLPGMTATVDFVVGSASQVLCAPNAALRFRPDASMVAGGAEPAAPVDGAGAGGAAAGGAAAGGAHGGSGARGAGRGGGRGGSGGRGALYTQGADGLLVRHVVKTGLTDGTCTEVESMGEGEGEGEGEGQGEGQGLVPDMALVAGEARPEDAAAGAGPTSPFQQQTSRGWRPGGF